MPDYPRPPTAAAIIDWTLDHHERVALSTSLGPQSLVILDLISELDRLDEVDVLFLETGLHFPETLDLVTRVEDRFGLSIQRLRPSQTVAEQAAEHGDRLWVWDPDACCHLRKVEPLRRALRGRGAWFTGLRRSHGGERADLRPVDWDSSHGLVKAAPLWDWSRDQVFEHLRTRFIPFNPLLEQGYASVGCHPCTRPSTTERGGRWVGFAKTECGIHTTPESSR